MAALKEAIKTFNAVSVDFNHELETYDAEKHDVQLKIYILFR